MSAAPATVPQGLALPPVRTEIEAAKRDLDEYGLTRFFGAADEDLLRRARRRLDAQAAGEDAHGCGFHDTGSEVINRPDGPNQRVWNLLNKGEVFAEIVLNPTIRQLVSHLLGEDHLLFSITANIAKAGGGPQALHGDQYFAPVETPYALIANTAWMLDDYTAENGATRVVPGSHRISRQPLPDEPVESLPAIGKAGTVMIWDGRLWHGTGVNRTDTPRRGILSAYCRPFIRQQENLCMSTSPEVMARASPDLLTLMGFRTWFGLGMIEGSRHEVLNARPTSFSGELKP